MGKNFVYRIKALFGALLALFICVSANAATVVYEYNISFGETSADGPAPWAVATFDDGGSAGSVTLSIETAVTSGEADFSEFYFNLNPLLDATNLSFLRTGGSGPTAANISWETGTNAFQADGDGIYDILLDLPPPPGQQAKRFNAGETLVFNITGIGSLTALDFNFLAEAGGGSGPFLSAAKVISTGESGQSSDWIAAVPVPAAVWLFGSALGALGWMRRKKST